MPPARAPHGPAGTPRTGRGQPASRVPPRPMPREQVPPSKRHGRSRRDPPSKRYQGGPRSHYVGSPLPHRISSAWLSIAEEGRRKALPPTPLSGTWRFPVQRPCFRLLGRYPHRNYPQGNCLGGRCFQAPAVWLFLWNTRSSSVRFDIFDDLLFFLTIPPHHAPQEHR